MKRGLSTIVSTLLILLLVFVAVGILWVVVRNVVMQGTEQVSLGKFTLDLAIDQVQLNNETNSILIKIKRNLGDGEFVGIKVIVFDEDNSEIFTINGSLREYERKSYSFILQLIDVDDIEKIQIAPVFRLESGKEITGDVKDTWEKSESSLGIVETTPNSNNSNVGLECTVDSNCTGIANSGNYCSGENVVRNNYNYFCNSLNECGYNSTTSVVENCSALGKICSGRICVEETVCETQAEVCITGVCGIQTNNCGEEFNCGSCGGGEVGQGDFIIYLQHDFEDNTLGHYLDSERQADWNDPPWCSRCAYNYIVRDTFDSENPTKVLRVYYPANSLGSSEGGTNWWATLDNPQDELYISYDIMFMPGFQYQWGGKLPSVHGGNPYAPRPLTGYDFFAGGLMFKQSGKIVFYAFYTDSKSNSAGAGDTYFWGAETDPSYWLPSSLVMEYNSGVLSKSSPGEWHTITYRMVLNSINSDGSANYDGILEAYFDGEMQTQISHLLFRKTEDLKIDTMRIYTFFGGSTDDWRNPIDEWVEFDNFVLYSFEDEANVPHGNQLSSIDRIIEIPDFD